MVWQPKQRALRGARPQSYAVVQGAHAIWMRGRPQREAERALAEYRRQRSFTLNVCLICDEYPPAPPGGIGSFVHDLAACLKTAGCGVTVMGVYSQTERSEVTNGGVRVIRLPSVKRRGRAGVVADRIRLARAVGRLSEEGSIDVVEAAEVGGWALGLPRRLPVVVRLHSVTRFLARAKTGGRRGRFISLIEDLALRRADAIVGVSRWVADHAAEEFPLGGLSNRQIEVIYNGVDTALFGEQPWSDRVPYRIVFAGTLKPQKGVVSLLRAFDRVVSEISEAELVLAGRDTLENGHSYFDCAVREAGISEEAVRRVRRRGALPRASLAQLYGSAAVCVFPSLGESFGLVAAEAMATGRPVIFSRTTAGPEVIHDGVSGLLVDPFAADDLAVATLRVLTNEKFARSLAQKAARAVRERFTIQQCGSKTLQLYHVVNRASRLSGGRRRS